MDVADRKSSPAPTPAAGKRSVSPTAVMKGGGERPSDPSKTPVKPADRKTRPSNPKKITRESDINKRRVFIQVTFVKIGEINPVKEWFEAEILVKSRWREPLLDETADEETEKTDFANYWNPKMFIENAIGDPWTKVSITKEVNAHSEAFLVERKKFRGIYAEFMNLWHFPFDIQDLSILLKSDTSAGSTELQNEPFEHHKILKRSMSDEEFHIYAFVFATVPSQAKNPNEQDLGSVKINRPCVKLSICAARRPQFFIYNVFLMVLLLTLLTFVSFSLESTTFLAQRLQLCFTIILSVVTFKNVVNAHVPKISYPTTLDKYYASSLVIMMVVTFYHGAATLLNGTDPISLEKSRGMMDNAALVLSGVAYLTINAIFIGWVVVKPYGTRRQKSKLEGKFVSSHGQISALV